MEELKSLVSVVSRNKVKQIEVIGNYNKSKNQVHRLYEQIAEGSIKTEQDILNEFFQDTENGTFYSSRLKNKLRDRLINTLFFIDINQPNLNEYNKAYYTCYKQAAAVKILVGKFARAAAVPLAERVLKNAIKFELTDIIVMMAHELCLHYAAFEGDQKKYEEYREITEKYNGILNVEYKAGHYLAYLRAHLTRARTIKPEVVDQAIKYSNELKELCSKYDSYRLNYLSFLVHSARYEITSEYEQLLTVSKNALLYFDSRKEFVPTTVVFSFSMRLFLCYVQLKKYKEAWSTIPMCLASTREGVNNWFLALEYFIILSFHSGRFQDAYKFYNTAIDNSEYQKQHPTLLERWLIYEAFISYLINRRKIKDDKGSFKKFRVSKFSNEVPIYSKDKRGINIPIIILQILFLLQQQKYGTIIDRMEALKAYTQRYLKRDDSFRSNCFIQMLLTLPECSFHKKAVLRKSEKYIDRLRKVPLNIANQSVEIEIVPYEMLWEFVLESLDEKWH